MIALQPKEVPLQAPQTIDLLASNAGGDSIDFPSGLELELLDAESGLPAVAMPPKPTPPIRRSFQNASNTTAITNTNSPPSQKRKRKQVSFRDEDRLVEVQFYERTPEECKADVWYNRMDLSEAFKDELQQNYHLCWIRGFGYPLEDHDLSWRGLEEHIPSEEDGYEGRSKRFDKIKRHTHILLAIVRTTTTTTGEGQQWDLGEHLSDLSKADSDQAIAKAKKDAMDVLEEQKQEEEESIETTPMIDRPSVVVQKEANDCATIRIFSSFMSWLCFDEQ